MPITNTGVPVPKGMGEPTEGGFSAISMWRSAFLAAGIFACVIGAELLIVDAVTLLPLDGAGAPRNLTAPDWAPWSLLSAGAVTIMHCLTAGGGSAPPLKKQLPPHHGFHGG